MFKYPVFCLFTPKTLHLSMIPSTRNCRAIRFENWTCELQVLTWKLWTWNCHVNHCVIFTLQTLSFAKLAMGSRSNEKFIALIWPTEAYSNYSCITELQLFLWIRGTWKSIYTKITYKTKYALKTISISLYICREPVEKSTVTFMPTLVGQMRSWHHNSHLLLFSH